MSGIELIYSDDTVVFEGPTWDARGQRLLFADLRRGRILSHGIYDGTMQVHDLGGGIGSFGMCESGRIVVAQVRTVSLFDPRTGDIEVLIDDLDEPEGNRFNDGRVGPDGCFWVGTRDGRRSQGAVPHGNGGLYRITPDGGIERKAYGSAVANGLAFTPDGATMYWSDSHNSYVDAWDLDPSSGAVSNQRRFASPTVAEGRPDGAACDADGYYWSAGISAGHLNRFDPSGTIVSRIKMPCPKPTMPCFADEYMFVTAMKHAPDAAAFVPQLEADDVSDFPLNVSGLFRLPAPVAGPQPWLFADA